MNENCLKPDRITAVELYALLQKLNINIQICEFHWHFTSSCILTEAENITGRDKYLDYLEFSEFFLKLFY